MNKPLSKIIKFCPTCKKEYAVHKYRINTAKFCSRTCKRSSFETRRLVSLHSAVKKGKESAHWKGDNVGYHGLHKWISLIAGKPNLCEFCGITKAKRFEWANETGLYKRIRDDWIRLCASCHRRYDRQRRLSI